nr:hypothetical protein [uncultured Brevundimonas sp.]
MAKLNPSDFPVAKKALMLGYKQHTIAALLGRINQARISEFLNGPLYALVVPAPALPAGWPPA